jgi:glycosyltransferase involved in cell wall biosynthesis
MPPSTSIEGVHVLGLPIRCAELASQNYFMLRRLLHRIQADIHYQRGTMPEIGMLAFPTPVRNLLWACDAVIRDHANYFVTCWQSDKRRDYKRAGRLVFNCWNQLWFNYGVRHAKAVVAQSREQQSHISSTWNRFSTVIPNGFVIPEPAVKSDPPIVLWVGNLREIKQPQLFVKVAQACQDIRARFVMVGHPMDKNLASFLERSSEELRNFSYLGGKSPQEAEQLMGEASLLINTSLYEGFPNTFIQSWLRATPALSLNVDPDNLMRREGIGLCTSSLEQLIKDTKRLLLAPDELVCMGAKARLYAMRDHNLESILLQYEALFSSEFDIRME